MTVLTTSPYAWENWVSYFKDFPIFFQGFLFTLAISVGAFIMAMFLGIVFGSLSSSKNKVLKSSHVSMLNTIRTRRFWFSS